MLQLTPQSTIFVATIHIDFRKGIDGLIAVCNQKLTINPMGGALFLFYNKSKTTIKVLSFDGQGFWLCTKRLSQGKFKYKIQLIFFYITANQGAMFLKLNFQSHPTNINCQVTLIKNTSDTEWAHCINTIYIIARLKAKSKRPLG